jgi:hypothetical protein
MHRTAFDENSHENHETDAHKYANIPIVDDPLLQRFQGFLV